MTKTLTATHISSIDELDKMPSHSVSCVNWEDFPYDPGTSFKIARLGNSLVIRYTINEADPYAVNTEDFQPVWEDSAVEFFCQTPGSKSYYNFEFNSNGAAVATSRTGQNTDVVELTPEAMQRIGRRVTKNPDSWTIDVAIPIDIIVENPSYPLELKGNFYKCGDKCATPHFLSWSPIQNPTPLFHCPQFFGTITVE